jgi:putative FmdB family regulatory protein
MANYEYMCEDKHITVDVRSMTEESKPTIICEICTKEAKRVYSAPPVQFKGSGFYSSRG